MNPARVVAALLLLTLLCSGGGFACPSCYGAQDSPMTAGMNTAILVMLGIIGSVLLSFVAFFLFLWRRNAHRPHPISDEAYVSTDGVLITHHEKGITQWNSI